MRIAVIAAVLALTASRAAADPTLTKARCSELGERATAISATFERLSRVVSAVDYLEISRGSAGSLQEAARKADGLSDKLRPLLDGYAAAMRDLEYQLRLCAR